MKAIYVEVEDKVHEATVAEAKKLGISVSAFIRLLLKQWGDGIRFEKMEKFLE